MSSDFTARRRASEALEKAEEALVLAEERLDGVAHNRMITFKDYYVRTVKTGWFSSKEILTDEYVTKSVKFTDIESVEESKDDDGNIYSTVILRRGHDLCVKESVSEVQRIINGG